MGTSGKTRVVILGGGHAGIRAAKRLLKLRRRKDLDVVVVSRENVEVWHGLMPQIVSGLIQPHDALVPLRQIVPGINLYTYEVERVDLEGRRVYLDRGDERDRVVLEYDYLVLALGSVSDVSRFPGLVEHGLQTKTIGDVFYLRGHLIDMLERAAVEQDPEERRRMLTFVVAGAGYAGVEIAAQANQLVREALRFYPSIAPSEVRVVLVSRAARILPSLSDKLVARAVRHLRRSGVELELGVGLAAATATAATLTDGRRLPTRSIIATVGIGTNPVIAALPVPLADGRIACDAYCRVPGWPGVYAVGDVAAVPDRKTGRAYPPNAFVAFTQGQHAASNIAAELRGEPPRPYHYEGIDAALLSKGYGLAEGRGLRLDGWLASIVWRFVFLAYIQTWQRRIALLQGWFTGSVFPRDIAQLALARSDALAPMRFGAGEVIIREGDPGSRFYIITTGEVEAVRRGADGREERVARLGPGQYFGEIALLTGVRRTATIRATVDTTVLSMARQHFSTLVEHMPELRDTFERTAGERGASPRQGADHDRQGIPGGPP